MENNANRILIQFESRKVVAIDKLLNQYQGSMSRFSILLEHTQFEEDFPEREIRCISLDRPFEKDSILCRERWEVSPKEPISYDRATWLPELSKIRSFFIMKPD